MELEEKIQAHILSVWKEGRGFFGGKGKEGMLILTNKRLLFIKKTEAGMKWWGAVRTRQTVRLLQSKDVMFIEDGYGEEKLRTDLENKKNQKIMNCVRGVFRKQFNHKSSIIHSNENCLVFHFQYLPLAKFFFCTHCFCKCNAYKSRC